MDPPGQVVFGGPAWPVGWGVGFLQKPLQDVYAGMRDWHRELRRPKYRYHELEGLPIVDQLLLLPPLQQPPKRQLIVATADGWTAHFDNSILGGDPVGWVGYLSSRFDCQGVIAVHIPRGQYPLPTTQFELLGPTGEKPLRYVRTVSAGIFDEGRWQFEAWGEEQPFEEPAAYSNRLIRERLTRELLLRYLSALGLDARRSLVLRRRRPDRDAGALPPADADARTSSSRVRHRLTLLRRRAGGARGHGTGRSRRSAEPPRPRRQRRPRA